MALKEPKAMAEVHKWQRKLFLKAKGKNIREKMVWISKQAKMLGVPRESLELKKAS